MPLFVATLVVAPRRRNATVAVPVPAPPLWWLVVDELTTALRSAWAHAAGRR
ncbi:MAG: hypothetical protein AB7H92_09585 [Microbacteriaceae bacterium]